MGFPGVITRLIGAILRFFITGNGGPPCNSCLIENNWLEMGVWWFCMGNLPEIDWKGLWETNGNIDTRIPLLELFEKVQMTQKKR